MKDFGSLRGLGWHISEVLFMYFWKTAMVKRMRVKGTSWLNVWGPSNSLKSWMVYNLFIVIADGQRIWFADGKIHGFTPNSKDVMWLDGWKLPTMKDGFTPTLMEDMTVGKDGKAVFGKKYAVDLPTTN